MAQASIKAIVGPLLAVLLLVTGASPAAAQISIPVPGSGGSIQIGPQQDQRTPDQNRYYGAAVSVRVLGAAYGGNCAGNVSTNVTNDLARQCQGRDYCVYRIDHRQLGDPRPGCAKDYRRAMSAATAATSATPRRVPRPPASRSCWTVAASTCELASSPGFNDGH